MAVDNYRYTYLRFKEDDVVASVCLRNIHYGWQFMFNYPQPLFLKHSNKLYPFIFSTDYVHIILLSGETRFVLTKLSPNTFT